MARRAAHGRDGASPTLPHPESPAPERSRRWIALLHRATEAFVGSGGGDAVVRCDVGGRTLSFQMPGNEIWVCVKDDLLLREYEWLGVDLQTMTGTVVDCGAHIGTFTAMAPVHADRVVAVEPNPASLAYLRANVARNGLDNVEVLDAALWIHDEGVDLHTQAVSSASSLVRGGDTAVGVNRVATITLPQLAERYGPIDLFKVDIEGAEFDVFADVEDAVLRQVGTYVGEIHSFLGDSSALADRLRAAGFSVSLRRGPFFHAGESMRQLRRNRASVHGQRRLKLALGVLYPVAAALDRLGPVRERLHYVDIEFLHAVRQDR